MALYRLYNQPWLFSVHPSFLTTLTRGRLIERSDSNSADLPTNIYCHSPFACSYTRVTRSEVSPRTPFSPQTSAEIFRAHKYCMSVRTVKWHLQLQRGVTKMSQGTFFDCVLSKYSLLLSVLHFKPFHASALLSIFTPVSIERPACGFKIEKYCLRGWGEGFKRSTYKATFLLRVNKAKGYVCLFPDATSPHEAEEPAVHFALIQMIFSWFTEELLHPAEVALSKLKVHICWHLCEDI